MLQIWTCFPILLCHYSNLGVYRIVLGVFGIYLIQEWSSIDIKVSGVVALVQDSYYCIGDLVLLILSVGESYYYEVCADDTNHHPNSNLDIYPRYPVVDRLWLGNSSFLTWTRSSYIDYFIHGRSVSELQCFLHCKWCGLYEIHYPFNYGIYLCVFDIQDIVELK